MATMTITQQPAQQNEKHRINELLAKDQVSNNQADEYYRQSLSMIRDNLQAFYAQYADENGLSLAQTRHAVTRWDRQQWRRAIRSVDMSEWDDEAKYRASNYSYQAGHNRGTMINSIIGLALVDMTMKYKNLVSSRLKADETDQRAHLERSLSQYLDREIKMPITYNLRPKQVQGTSVITQQSTQELWSSRLWSDSGTMANDVQNLVNKHLRHGMSIEDMQGLLREHVNPGQFKPGMSLADRAKQMDFNTQRIVRTESARLVDEVNMTTYKMNGVSLVAWVTEPGACAKCQNIAESGPYLIDDCPVIPDDTHPNCRCSKIPVIN